MATLEISVVPVGTGSTSVSDTVAEVVRVARERGVKHELTGMGTSLEGDLETLFSVAREMHEAAFRHGAGRVYTVIKLDDRRDRESTLEGKRESAARKAGEG